MFQLGPKKVVLLGVIEDKWKDIGLPKEQFDELARIGGFSGGVDWLKFFSLACSALGEVGEPLRGNRLCVCDLYVVVYSY